MKNNIFNLVLLFLSIGSFSQIVNQGTLKITDGTTVYFGEEYTNKAGATHDNQGNLHLNNNLINNGTMTVSADANLANGITYFDSPTNVNATINTIQTISGSEPIVFENLQLNMTDASSVGVLVSANTNLTVENGVNLNAGDLRLVGEAQLIQKQTSTNANTGTGKLLRDQKGTIDQYNYNYWSSPVSGAIANTYQVGEVLFDGTDATINPFTPTQITYSSASPWNGTPTITDGSGNVTTPANIESYWIWKFDNGTIDDDNDWFLQRNNTAFEAGLGFTMKGTNETVETNQKYTFKGKPNDGNYSFAIDPGKSFMLGNPYPSALDAFEFITNNSAVLADVTMPSATTGAIYYWEHWGGNSHNQQDYQGGYATYTLAMGTPPTSHIDVQGGGTNSGINGSRYVPVAQGFFVESLTGGTINFKNSQRAFKLEDGNSYFRRPNNTNTKVDLNKSNEEDQTQRIRLGYNAPNGFYRQIGTAFIPKTNDGHNTAYDARMAYIHNNEMYWVINNTPYVIDARPYAIDKQIPIGINVNDAGIHKIFLFEAENFTENIYILDTDTGYTHDIRQSDFEVNLDDGQYLNRFFLVFEEHSPLAVNEFLNQSLQVFYANNTEDIIIKNPTNLEIKDVKIFNAIGQLVKQVSETKLLEQTKIRIPFHVADGTYIIQVNSNKGKSGFKILAY